MANITMSIDNALLRRVRKFALERNTSVNAIVRDHLRELSAVDAGKGEAAARKFLAAVRKYKVCGWKKPASRAELYER
jgi:predicted TIM-barrel fold metal-dependent hydrolase